MVIKVNHCHLFSCALPLLSAFYLLKERAALLSVLSRSHVGLMKCSIIIQMT
jgi:hypothetical protein